MHNHDIAVRHDTGGAAQTLNPLAEYLAEHADSAIDPATVGAKKIKAWLTEADGSARAGARSAYLVGRTLRAQRPKHGKVAAWSEEQAAKLGRAPRSICLYMQVAQVIDSESATPLPISILDRPLREVPKAIKNVRAGLAPDAKHAKAAAAPKQPPTVQVLSRRLVEAIGGLADAERTQALVELLALISAVGATLAPEAAKRFIADAKKILRVHGGSIERTDGYDAYGTPERIIEVVRQFAARKCSPGHNGLINLDPATSPEHNEVIGAERFFAVADDGLAHEWLAHFVWLNPPFGTTDKNGSIKELWFEKAVNEYQAGRCTEAVVLLPLTIDRRWFEQVKPWPRVDLRGKVHFRGPGTTGSKTGISLVYLGADVQGFFDCFAAIGDPVPGVPMAAEMQSTIDELFGHDRRAA